MLSYRRSAACSLPGGQYGVRTIERRNSRHWRGGLGFGAWTSHGDIAVALQHMATLLQIARGWWRGVDRHAGHISAHVSARCSLKTTMLLTSSTFRPPVRKKDGKVRLCHDLHERPRLSEQLATLIRSKTRPRGARRLHRRACTWCRGPAPSPRRTGARIPPSRAAGEETGDVLVGTIRLMVWMNEAVVNRGMANLISWRDTPYLLHGFGVAARQPPNRIEGALVVVARYQDPAEVKAEFHRALHRHR